MVGASVFFGLVRVEVEVEAMSNDLKGVLGVLMGRPGASGEKAGVGVGFLGYFLSNSFMVEQNLAG